MELRPYQKEAVDAIITQWDNGFKRTLLVLPTGTGKTVVFSKVVEQEVKDGSNALILAHRGELLEQASDKLRLTSGLDSALEKAESTSIGSGLQVTVASIQTISQEKRLTKFPKDYFKTIIVDEAHHSMSERAIKGCFNISTRQTCLESLPLLIERIKRILESSSIAKPMNIPCIKR